MDPGRSKNQSSHNQMKPTPLCLSCHYDSDHIKFFVNGCCMRKISRSDQFPKHAKSQLVKVNANVSSTTGEISMMLG